ncbi:type II toxin-antitoxin system VapC family toxin [Rhodopseudomonas palustris]|uniref:type II toxin-antitoxin system VapC family toxin n=1 Tax=Rhodopseudomonas palustris TaxID=1076 RepID=UPI0020CF92CA|nr:type II toxin-antitoxin system VapC family toxin [Rhodopseudomonas palustris]
MNIPLLLDTCAAIWIGEDQPIAPEAAAMMNRAVAAAEPVYVSLITGWEIGLLVSRGRLNLLASPHRWFERLMQAPGLQLAGLTPDILIASSFLPGVPPRDPADRIFAATAREYGYRLITRDRSLLAYAREGHIQALAC